MKYLIISTFIMFTKKLFAKTTSVYNFRSFKICDLYMYLSQLTKTVENVMYIV